MNRYQWLMWAFRLFFSSEVIAEVKKLVVRLENSDSLTGGSAKRDFVEESVLPMVKNVGVFLLRALIEAVLAEVKNERS